MRPAVFLPIAERELRVAARKRGTYWLRGLAGLVAILIGFGFMIPPLLGATNTSHLGPVLFGFLTWLLLAACFLAGLFLTSDCISAEKREGTLGFLFLTDLRGYDVILGKLVSTSLRGAYCLVAVFPVLAITLLMGGVAVAHFWKAALALVNAFFCSLAVGLLASTVSHNAQRAYSVTLLLLLTWIGLGPLADVAMGEFTGRPRMTLLTLSSPGYTFSAAGPVATSTFWAALGVNIVIAVTFFALASVLVRRTWQVRDTAGRRGRVGGTLPLTSRKWRVRDALRRKLMDPNPVVWLARRGPRRAVGIWMIAVAGLILAAILTSTGNSSFWMAWSTFGGLMAFLLFIIVAAQAPRFFLELRESGMAEVLVATPLRVEEIIRGQWRVFLRDFSIPLLLFFAVHAFGSTRAILATWGNIGAQTGVVLPSVMVGIVATAVSLVSGLFDIAALCWFGMYMGLTSKGNNVAALKTMVFVEVIPWFILSFVSAVGTALLMARGMMTAGPAAMNAVVSGGLFTVVLVGVPASLRVAKDIGFIVWSRARLLSRFRELVTRAPGAVVNVPVPPVIAAPPPIIASATK